MGRGISGAGEEGVCTRYSVIRTRLYKTKCSPLQSAEILQNKAGFKI